MIKVRVSIRDRNIPTTWGRLYSERLPFAIIRNIPTTWGRHSALVTTKRCLRNIPTTWGRPHHKLNEWHQFRNIPTTWGRHLTKIILYIKILEKTDFYNIMIYIQIFKELLYHSNLFVIN